MVVVLRDWRRSVVGGGGGSNSWLSKNVGLTVVVRFKCFFHHRNTRVNRITTSPRQNKIDAAQNNHSPISTG